MTKKPPQRLSDLEVIKVCPIGRHMWAWTEDPNVMEQWEQISDWALVDFEPLDETNCWEGCPRIHRMFQEGRSVDVRLAAKGDRPKF
jgi:hypothetical protein